MVAQRPEDPLLVCAKSVTGEQILRSLRSHQDDCSDYTTRKCDTGYRKSSPESSTIR